MVCQLATRFENDGRFGCCRGRVEELRERRWCTQGDCCTMVSIITMLIVTAIALGKPITKARVIPVGVK